MLLTGNTKIFLSRPKHKKLLGLSKIQYCRERIINQIQTVGRLLSAVFFIAHDRFLFVVRLQEKRTNSRISNISNKKGGTALTFRVHTDSSSDIPLELAKQARIKVTPMPVTIDGHSFLEGVNIFPDQFYAGFPQYVELPKTSQPNLQDLINDYNQILQEGSEVVSILLSSGLSSTYNTGLLAREMCNNPNRVHVIDSLGASIGYGLIALFAAEVLKTCDHWENAEKQILSFRDSMRYIFTPNTLEYLIKGGRAGKIAGFVGGLLDIKPILQVTKTGTVEPLTKVRSRRSAIRKLADILCEEISHPEEQVIGISHSSCLDDAEALLTEIRSRIPVKNIILSEIGCIIGSHTGPGTLALFYRNA